MRKATIIMLVLGITMSCMDMAYGNWFTQLIGIARPATHQTTNAPDPTKGDMRRVR